MQAGFFASDMLAARTNIIPMLNRLPWLGLCLVLAWFAGSGCSIRKYVLNRTSDALAQSGTTFAEDDDPELV